MRKWCASAWLVLVLLAACATASKEIGGLEDVPLASELGFYGNVKHQLLKEQAAALRDTEAGFSAWCKKHSKPYAGLQDELSLAVYNAYVHALKEAVKHNADPKATWVADATSAIDLDALHAHHSKHAGLGLALPKHTTAQANTDADAEGEAGEVSGNEDGSMRVSKTRDLLATKRSPPSKRRRPPPPRRHRRKPPPKNTKRSPPPKGQKRPLPVRPTPPKPPAPSEFNKSIPLFGRGALPLTPDMLAGIAFAPPLGGAGNADCPLTVDNRQYMPPVENQGRCGSCWTFAITAAVEGSVSKQYGSTVTLSKQQLLDCASPPNIYCSGGYPNWLVSFMMIGQGKGVVPQVQYPYVSFNGGQKAQAQRDADCAAAGDGVRLRDVQAVANGESGMFDEFCFGRAAVSVFVYACSFWQTYSVGVLTASCPQDEVSAHLVTVVGYGTESGVDYWLIKNSWGDGWGERGYIKIQRGVGNSQIHRATFGTLDTTSPYLGRLPPMTQSVGPAPMSMCADADKVAQLSAAAGAATSSGKAWAVAASAACSPALYAADAKDVAEASERVLEACNGNMRQRGLRGVCKVVATGNNTAS